MQLPFARKRRSAKLVKGSVIYCPRLEVLEDRCLLSPYLVTTTADSGPGSLRDGIIQVNADTSHSLYSSPSDSTKDEIDFQIGTGLQTVTPLSALPAITNPTILDATTQPGFSGTPVIQLTGTSAGAGVDGLVITAGNSTVRGLVVNDFSGSGIVLSGGGNDAVTGNYIGTDATGTAALANGLDGVRVYSSNNLIGGNTAADRNVISGNGMDGVLISGSGASGNSIIGNYIGPDVSGSVALPNSGNGVELVSGASNNYVGSTGPTLLVGSSVNSKILRYTATGQFLGTFDPGNSAGLFGPEGLTIGPDGKLYVSSSNNRQILRYDAVTGKFLDVFANTGASYPRDLTFGPNGDLFVATYTKNEVLRFDGHTGAPLGNFLGPIGWADPYPLTPAFGPDGNLYVGSYYGNIYRYNGSTGAFKDVFGSGEVLTFGPDGDLYTDNYYGGVIQHYSGITGALVNTIFQDPLPSGGPTGLIFGPDGTLYVSSYNDSRVLRFNVATNTFLGNAISPGSGGLSYPDQGLVFGPPEIVGNVISGNGKNGVTITDAGTLGNLVEGNIIGLDATGSKALGTDSKRLGNYGAGVFISGGATGNAVGGLTGTPGTGAGNVISGNGGGVFIGDVGTSGNVIEGNIIGLDATGTKTADVNGASLGNASDGVAVFNATEITIGGTISGARNVISNNAVSGVRFGASTYDVVAGNYIGTDVTGEVAMGNGYGYDRGAGILLQGAANSNILIGGTTLNARNIISGNYQSGGILFLGSSYNQVEGNYIGTDATGNIALGNGSIFGAGIYLDTPASNNTIGGLTSTPGTSAGNIISGNGAAGVELATNNGPTVSGNVVEGNRIGLGANGNSVGNGSVGVLIRGGVSNTTIGGTPAGAANVIDANSGAGVAISDPSTGNVIRGNSIYGNSGTGIDLSPGSTFGDGVTLNDSSSHTGGNNLQNFPVLTSAFTNGTSTTITGSFSESAEPNQLITLDFYANAVADPSGYGEGQTYLGNATVTTNGSGNVSFSVTLPVTVTRGQFVTATATDAAGNTSEFSADLQVPLQVPSVTTVTASANPSVLSQAVTFTATVTPSVGSGTPTGTVQFQIDGANVGSLLTLSGGQTSFSTATLSVGTHTITAVYSGDSFSLASNGTLTQNVDYKFIGFLPPLNQNMAFGINRTVGIKFQLTDYNGSFISSLSAVSSLQVTGPSGTISLTGSLRYDSSANQFVANWSTKGLTAGSYTITLRLNDGTVKSVTIQLTTNGKGGATQMAIGSDGGDNSGLANTLLAGDLNIYINDPNRYFTAEELARIQDTINGLDTLLAPYGVTITAVSDSGSANLVLDTGFTSACGGAANGVLGCFNGPAGEITILQGWNWYAGPDATKIGSAQYDFQSTVTHEFGHALGLGGATDPNSPMYETLAMRQVHRIMTVADLNLLEPPEGPDPERVAPPLCDIWCSSDALLLNGQSPPSYGISSAAGNPSTNQHAPLSAVLSEWTDSAYLANTIAGTLGYAEIDNSSSRFGGQSASEQNGFWSDIGSDMMLDAFVDWKADFKAVKG